MRLFIKITGAFLLTSLLQQCSFSQNNPVSDKSTKMDTSKNNNPVYSTTDTSKINMSEEEWKKVLPAEVFYKW
jgi:peptide-methionine (R)-S-oxide reductase